MSETEQIENKDIYEVDKTENDSGVIMSNTSVPATFEKLDGRSNFIDWKYAMKIHLINCELWEFVEGTKVDAKQESRALAAIVSGVKTQIFTDIRELKTGGEVWFALRILVRRQLCPQEHVNRKKGISSVASVLTVTKLVTDL